MTKGSHHTDETRAKLAALRGEKHPFYGRKLSPETRAKISEAKRGKPSGMLGKHCSEEHKSKIGAAQRGTKNHSWKGGRQKQGGGYIRVLSLAHPCADRLGRVMEHRLVMEAHLGRTLLPTEVVHHINGIKDDNRIDNLQRFDSAGDHTSYHDAERRM